MAIFTAVSIHMQEQSTAGVIWNADDAKQLFSSSYHGWSAMHKVIQITVVGLYSELKSPQQIEEQLLLHKEKKKNWKPVTYSSCYYPSITEEQCDMQSPACKHLWCTGYGFTQALAYMLIMNQNTSQAGRACWLECRTRDQKVASSNLGRSSRRIFFSRVNFVCWLLFDVRATPVLQQWHVKDPGHSAKSAGGRLHLNTHTPLTRESPSGLTMPLSRQSVGIYQETSSHATHQGTLSHSHHSALSHWGLILALRVELVCVS